MPAAAAKIARRHRRFWNGSRCRAPMVPTPPSWTRTMRTPAPPPGSVDGRGRLTLRARIARTLRRYCTGGWPMRRRRAVVTVRKARAAHRTRKRMWPTRRKFDSDAASDATSLPERGQATAPAEAAAAKLLIRTPFGRRSLPTRYFSATFCSSSLAGLVSRSGMIRICLRWLPGTLR